jgi:hypothetical protein
MKSNKNIIAIGGNARSGKDTLGKHIVSLLREYGVNAKTYSFADQLKEETDDFLKKTLNISSFTEDTYEKNIIRPFLVFWGTEIRRKINDLVWVDKIANFIPENEVAIITDLRFPNELKWVRDNEGQVLFVSRIDEEGNVIQPANEYELENNSIISSDADNNFTWYTTENEELLKSIANEVLDSVLTEERFQLWKATCI